jgi:2-methylisocitrate lyase-like PEP mutase family enzyme
LKRAHAYVDAGTDAILMHSKRKDHNEIEAFMKVKKNEKKNKKFFSLIKDYI